MLLAVRQDRFVLLERRPPTGIWGGLWGLPEFDSAGAACDWYVLQFGAAQPVLSRRPLLRHSFTHFDLDIEPLLVECSGGNAVMEEGRWLWYDSQAPAKLGLAAPVKQMIQAVLPSL